MNSRKKASIRIPLIALFLLAVGYGSLNAEDQIITLPDGKRVVLHDDYTWEYYNQRPTYDFDFSTLTPTTVPPFLRGGIQVDVATQKTAVEMYLQGWRYSMPVPKSSQAAWGNGDGRTTWFYGYWYNEKTRHFSAKTPRMKQNGIFIGDDQNLRNYWRNGGSPPFPSAIEWLLSQSGGVKPHG